MLPKDLVAASSRPLLLALLAGGESYGYELIRGLRGLSGGEFEWTEGTLYPVLHRLEREGLIKSSWQESEQGRKRKYYTITAAGRRATAAEKCHWLLVHNILEKLWKQNSI